MNRIRSIDGLRGLAALAVVLFHYGRFFDAALPGVSWGYLAVDLFFIISGFILSARYLESIARGETSFGKFFVRRIARLWPLHIFAIALIFLENWFFFDHLHLFRVASGYATFDIFSNILMFQGFTNTSLLLNPPSWSISAELIVNLLWVGALLRGWGARIGAFATAICIGCLLLHETTLAFSPYIRVFGILPHGLLRSAAGFGIGCLIFRHRPKLPLPSMSIPFLMCSALVLLRYQQEIAAHGGDFLIAYGLFPLMTIAALQDGSFARFLERFGWLGTISYSVYLLQVPVACGIDILPVYGMGEVPPRLGFIYLAALLVISTAGYFLVERPGIRVVSAALRTFRRLLPTTAPMYAASGAEAPRLSE